MSKGRDPNRSNRKNSTTENNTWSGIFGGGNRAPGAKDSHAGKRPGRGYNRTPTRPSGGFTSRGRGPRKIWPF